MSNIEIREFTIGGIPEKWNENKISSQGIPYSRYAASWAKVGGSFKGIYANSKRVNRRSQYVRWLESLGLPENEVYEMYKIMNDGKYELEENASTFLKSLEESE